MRCFKILKLPQKVDWGREKKNFRFKFLFMDKFRSVLNWKIDLLRFLGCLISYVFLDWNRLKNTILNPQTPHLDFSIVPRWSKSRLADDALSTLFLQRRNDEQHNNNNNNKGVVACTTTFNKFTDDILYRYLLYHSIDVNFID